MNGCAHRDDWLLDLLDDELPPELAAEVEEHLAACDDCRQAVEDYRAIIDSYRTGPVEDPPVGETARILRTAAASTGRPGWRGRVALAAAATLLLLGGAVGGYLLRAVHEKEATPVELVPSPMAQEAELEAAEMRRTLAEMQQDLERAKADKRAALQAVVTAGEITDAGIETAKAAKAVQAAKAATGEAGGITGGAVKVDGPRGGSAGLAAPRWQAKEKALSDDPLSGDMGL